MSDYKLPRNGLSPVIFSGIELASSNGHWANGQEQTRWHEIAVYRTDAGNYVLAITYRTCWQGEQVHHAVILLGRDKARLSAEIASYDPLAYVQGFPPGAQYEDRQTRLRASLRQRFDAQISKLLEAIPGTEQRIA